MNISAHFTYSPRNEYFGSFYLFTADSSSEVAPIRINLDLVTVTEMLLVAGCTSHR